MVKYILSSGFSVISEISTTSDGMIAYTITNQADKAIQFDSMGEAMNAAIEIAKILGSSCYHAVSINV